MTKTAGQVIVEAQLRRHRFREMRRRPGVWRRRLGRRFVAYVTADHFEVAGSRKAVSITGYHQIDLEELGKTCDDAIHSVLNA